MQEMRTMAVMRIQISLAEREREATRRDPAPDLAIVTTPLASVELQVKALVMELAAAADRPGRVQRSRPVLAAAVGSVPQAVLAISRQPVSLVGPTLQGRTAAEEAAAITTTPLLTPPGAVAVGVVGPGVAEVTRAAVEEVGVASCPRYLGTFRE